MACNLVSEMVTLQTCTVSDSRFRKSDKIFFSYGVFVDFKKVFNMVSYPIFISKLEYYGVRGIANNWFQFFLTNRKQFTSVNDYNSTYQQITHRVPQGSVLGLLLFILFINDLDLFVNDDIHLLFTNNSLKK